MRYTIPFVFHGKENCVTVDYGEMPDARAAGFHILKLPFAADACRGYPMIHAYFGELDLQGYERYCGWIQIIRREEFNRIDDASPSKVCYEPDVPDGIAEHGLPYIAYGYPPELFDAPCRNLRGCGRLIWRAYTYLVDIPSRINGYRLSCLAGFTWGYSENCNGEVALLAFDLLNEADWDGNFDGLRKTCQVCFGVPDMVCVPEASLLNVPEAAAVAEPLLERFERAGEECAASLTLCADAIAALETPMIPREEYVRQVKSHA